MEFVAPNLRTWFGVGFAMTYSFGAMLLSPIAYYVRGYTHFVLIFTLPMILLLIYPWWVHDDVIKWKHFPCYWPFVRGIRRSPVNPPHNCQWRGALMISLIRAWINGSVNNREAAAGDLRRHCVHYDVTVMNRDSKPWSRCKSIPCH